MVYLYYDFLSNVLNVLFLCAAVIWINLSLNKKYSPYFLGVMFGLITILTMDGKITVVPGRFYDFRHITMTMAGFVGGPVTAAIAAIISSLYRYNVGGSGSMGGVTSIAVFACFGTFLRKYIKSTQTGKKLFFWCIIGMFMACIFLFIIGFIPPWKGDAAKVLRIVTAPYLIITPLATTIIFNFYFWTYDFLGKASILNTILANSPLNLMVFNNHGPLLLSKNITEKCSLKSFTETPNLLLNRYKSVFDTTKQLQQEILTENNRYFIADLARFQMPSGEEAYVAIINDITDQKKEQKKLRGATDRFRKTFQLSPNMMAILKKPDYRYIDVNNRFLEERGFSREEVIGKTPIEMGVPEQEFKLITKIINSQGSVHNIESALITKFGTIGTSILSAETITMDDQECILIACNDVTEMKRMQRERVDQLTKYLSLEAELSRSNQLIADIINHMPDGFYVLDHQWRFTFINNKAEELLRKSRNKLLGNVLWKEIPQAQGTFFHLNYQKAIAHHEPMTFEYQSFLEKGIWYQVKVYPSENGLSVYYQDITEQKTTCENLIKSQQEIVSILESMTDCFLAVDRNTQLTYINRAGEIAFGRSRDELLGKKMTEEWTIMNTALLHSQDVLSENKSITFEVFSEVLGNKWFEVSTYPTETGLSSYFRDITDRKVAQDEMARLDRLNLVGQMAAGIGHEIRNPMTTVRGYLQLMGVKPDYAAQKSTFELMISELDRANDIITEFLSLAQTKQTELKLQSLNDILTHLYPLLEADAFTQNKRIQYIPEKIPNLELNRKEITQLILNIARNGLEAMEEGGSLTLKTYLYNNQVVLAIKDEGCGIPPENMNKLGIPFYTTKDYGTGLGLATSYKIVESHNAKIRVDSNSSGTTFYIVFSIPNLGEKREGMIA
ncbi:PAS domain S-box protein [Desulfosporosinus sp. FKB]|uniref:PAS domain S-box protein n=1 Tax=Desulfosporosinus sp. FKB TaxID=1969835 RepID=UPI0032B81676